MNVINALHITRDNIKIVEPSLLAQNVFINQWYNILKDTNHWKWVGRPSGQGWVGVIQGLSMILILYYIVSLVHKGVLEKKNMTITIFSSKICIISKDGSETFCSLFPRSRKNQVFSTVSDLDSFPPLPTESVWQEKLLLFSLDAYLASAEKCFFTRSLPNHFFNKITLKL